MNGMNLSGNPGIVQAMQMPPTFGQPPTPLTQPRIGTLQRTTGPLQPSLTRQRPSPWLFENSAWSANPARSQLSCTVRPKIRAAGPARRARAAGPRRPAAATRQSSVCGDVVGLDRAAGQVDDGGRAATSSPSPGSRAGPSRRSGCCASPGSRRRRRTCRARARRPPSARAGRSRWLVRIGWPVSGSTPIPAQCPSPLTSSLGTEPSSTSMNGSSSPGSGVEPRPHELVAGLEREHRVVQHDRRHARQRAAQQILERRVGRRRHRDRVAVAAQPAGDPEDVERTCARAGVMRRSPSPVRDPLATRVGGALDQRLEVLVEPAVEVPVAGAAGDQPGARASRASAWEIDGRSAATS